MPYVNHIEFGHFLSFLRRRMDLWPWYVSQLVQLGGRRIRGLMRRALARDIHAIGKQRPPWLDRSDPGKYANSETPLRFAEYEPLLPNTGPASSCEVSLEFSDDDPEGYWAGHRWAECVMALIDHRYLMSLDKVIEWMSRTLPKTDTAWEPYSSSERVANLVVLLSARPEYRGQIETRCLRAFLWESLVWIDRHLEYYGPTFTNNHILNNARALVVGGTALQCSEFVERGLILFSRMGRELFQRGGFLRERSSNYQVIVTNWICDAVHFSRVAAVESAAASEAQQQLEDLAARVVRATSVLLGGLGGQASHVGDISPDLSPSLAIERLRRLYPQISHEVAMPVQGCLDDWVFASNGTESLVLCSVTAYPAAFTTHGHRDLGSFVWLHKRIPVLVDAGRFRYMSDPASRFQVTASAHNSLLINGVGPLPESMFAFAQWFPKAYSDVEGSIAVDSCRSVIIRHNGFSRMRGVGDHLRKVRMEPEGLVVEDHVEGMGLVNLELFWHFPPGFAPTSSGPADIAGAGLLISVASAGSGAAVPVFDWQVYPYSSAYGRQESAYQLRIAWSLQLPCVIHTAMEVVPCAA